MLMGILVPFLGGRGAFYKFSARGSESTLWSRIKGCLCDIIRAEDSGAQLRHEGSRRGGLHLKLPSLIINYATRAVQLDYGYVNEGGLCILVCFLECNGAWGTG